MSRKGNGSKGIHGVNGSIEMITNVEVKTRALGYRGNPAATHIAAPQTCHLEDQQAQLHDVEDDPDLCHSDYPTLKGSGPFQHPGKP